jgi:hypothetical protein
MMTLDKDGISAARRLWLHDHHGLSLRLRGYDSMLAGRLSPTDFTNIIATPAQLAEDLDYTARRYTDY